MDLRCGLDGDFQNRATSKSSMFRFGFSIINHPFGVPLIFRNLQIRGNGDATSCMMFEGTTSADFVKN
jgi:hypothetical protein